MVGGVNAAVQPVAAAPGEASTASCVVMICCHLRVAAFHHWLPESRLIATTTRATPVSSEALPDTASGPPGLGMVEPSAGLVTIAVGGTLPLESTPNAYRKPSLLVM